MKREILLVVTFIALAAVACSLFGAAPAGQPGVATIVAAASTDTVGPTCIDLPNGSAAMTLGAKNTPTNIPAP